MEEVLYIGPGYKDHRGGIGAVMEVYARNVRPFKCIQTYSYKSFAHQFFTYVSAVFRLFYVLLSDRRIRILHIHSASRGSFTRKSLLLLIGKFFGKKVILHIHGAEFHIFYARGGILRGYIRFILRKADVIVCLSEQWRSFFSTNFKIRRLEIINNVIEKAPAPGNIVSKNGHIHFLFLGYIGNRKGIFDFLEVVTKNGPRFRDQVKITVGGNGDVERLKEVINRDYSTGGVEYAGWVKGSRKTELLHQCDVYILPSYNEGLPISVLEALAHGKPVISTRVGGIPEVVKPGYNGWLFDPGDQIALESIIGEVLENKSKLKEYGNNSLTISQSYTPDAVFRTLKELYNQLIND